MYQSKACFLAIFLAVTFVTLLVQPAFADEQPADSRSHDAVKKLTPQIQTAVCQNLKKHPDECKDLAFTAERYQGKVTAGVAAFYVVLKDSANRVWHLRTEDPFLVEKLTVQRLAGPKKSEEALNFDELSLEVPSLFDPVKT